MEQKQIATKELAFHSLSFIDYNARLFKWNGGLYRGIKAQSVSLYREILRQGIIQTLVEKKLFVETELSDLIVEDYQLVLKHRLLPFVSYPWEWCDLMLKEAALLHLDFCLELEGYDLTTDDAHPLNILFDGCQPLFIDLGSIEFHSPGSTYWLWPPYGQFCQCFLNPLRLMAQGKGRIARWLLHDYEQGVLDSDLEVLTVQSRSNFQIVKSMVNQAKSFLKQKIPQIMIPWFKQIRSLVKSQINSADSQPSSLREFLQQIRQEVAGIQLIENHHNSPLASIDWISENLAQDERANRRQKVEAVLSQLKPNSVLEIDNYNPEPWFARVAASQGSQVVVFTSEENRATQLYLDAKANQLSILPLILDFSSPSYDLANNWFNPASDRLKCELVLALDLVDRLVFEQYHVAFETIVERLASFCDRWLVVEFIAREYPYRLQWSEDLASRFVWYRLDNFIASLESKFSQVTTLGNISDTRVLLLCEK